MRKLVPILGALAALIPHPAAALFHIAVIDEVMTSYDGDPNVQFVEILILGPGQTLTTNSILGAFDGSGNFEGEILIVPGDLENGGNGGRWLMGTTAFEAASGLQVDFEFAPGLLPQTGMICWGAPNLIPPPPANWNHTVPANYVDCVAYGEYTGATNVHIGTPTPLSPDGHSLRRVSETDNNIVDFACGDPADPTNDDGETVDLELTTPCPEPAQAALLAVGACALFAARRRA